MIHEPLCLGGNLMHKIGTRTVYEAIVAFGQVIKTYRGDCLIQYCERACFFQYFLKAVLKAIMCMEKKMILTTLFEAK